MKVAYKNDMPIMKLKVKGSKGQFEYDAYLDTGAGRTLIPEKDAKKLGLPYAGDTTVITGSGKDTIRLYRARIEFLGRVPHSGLWKRPTQASTNKSYDRKRHPRRIQGML